MIYTFYTNTQQKKIQKTTVLLYDECIFFRRQIFSTEKKYWMDKFSRLLTPTNPTKRYDGLKWIHYDAKSNIRRRRKKWLPEKILNDFHHQF